MPEKKGWQNPEMVDRNVNRMDKPRSYINILLFSNWRTFLGPISVDLIFYAPNVANLGFWRIEPKIAF